MITKSEIKTKRHAYYEVLKRTHPETIQKYREQTKKYRLLHPDWWKKYRKEHPEVARKAEKKWREKHVEQSRENTRKYRLLFPEKVKGALKKWRVEHSNQIREYNNEYRKKHAEQVKNWNKKYLQSPKGKISNKKHYAYRRKLGFVPLNESFFGAVGHHIDTKRVVYVPEKLHKSIQHSLSRKKSMEKLNRAVLDWMIKGNKSARIACLSALKAVLKGE